MNFYFVEALYETHAVTQCMPSTYENRETANAISYLHYFSPHGDWYILEKDIEHEQLQAFGVSQLNGYYPEYGYISLVDLLSHGVELDLHFTPKPVRELGLNFLGLSHDQG
jgi:hypothetical protein